MPNSLNYQQFGNHSVDRSEDFISLPSKDFCSIPTNLSKFFASRNRIFEELQTAKPIQLKAIIRKIDKLLGLRISSVSTDCGVRIAIDKMFTLADCESDSVRIEKIQAELKELRLSLDVIL